MKKKSGRSSMDPSSRGFASSRKQVGLPAAVFKWDREDFGNSDEQPLKFVVRYLPQHVERDLAMPVECFRRVKTGGEGRARGADIWGEARPPGWNAS